jgi:hypothetical protein
MDGRIDDDGAFNLSHAPIRVGLYVFSVEQYSFSGFRFPRQQAFAYSFGIQTEHGAYRLEGKQPVGLVGEKPQLIVLEQPIRGTQVFPVILQSVF